MRSQAKQAIPLPIIRIMRKLGEDIRDARLRRRISTAMMAERSYMSRTTLNKIEKGDPNVSFGLYATILFVLGLSERINELADMKQDEVGLQLSQEQLPKRIHYPKKKRDPSVG